MKNKFRLNTSTLITLLVFMLISSVHAQTTPPIGSNDIIEQDTEFSFSFTRNKTMDQTKQYFPLFEGQQGIEYQFQLNILLRYFEFSGTTSSIYAYVKLITEESNRFNPKDSIPILHPLSTEHIDKNISTDTNIVNEPLEGYQLYMLLDLSNAEDGDTFSVSGSYQINIIDYTEEGFGILPGLGSIEVADFAVTYATLAIVGIAILIILVKIFKR